MDVAITQSREWQKLQDDLGETSFFKQTEDYQYLAILKKAGAGNYLYCPYGPSLKTKKSLEKALKDLQVLAKKHNATFIRIEPILAIEPDFLRSTAKSLSFTIKKSKDLNPKETWVLDLTPDYATLITNFSQGTRTRYNTYAKKGLTVEQTTDPSEIHHLVALQKKLYEKKHLHAFSERYLKTELEQPFASLYLVKYHDTSDRPAGNYPADGQVIAASLFFDYNGTRYYMQSAADSDYKKLPATVALLTKALFDAKEQGMTAFDFWGIAPDDAPDNHPWKGFTEFKKSFGGAAIHYTGTYDLVLNPTKYKIYQLARKIKRASRR